jgi:hypothetical protein
VPGYPAGLRIVTAITQMPDKLERLAKLTARRTVPDGTDYEAGQKLLWVKRVGLTVGQPLRADPDQRTSSDRPGMSGWCQPRTYAVRSQGC